MKRKSFLKSLLAILVAPKILGSIGANKEGLYRTGENSWNWYEPTQRLPGQIRYEAKLQDLINRKPPPGYAIGFDKYKWSAGDRIRVWSFTPKNKQQI